MKALVRSMVALSPVEEGDEVAKTLRSTLRYTNPAYVRKIRFGTFYGPKPPQFLYAYIADIKTKTWWVPRAWYFKTFIEGERTNDVISKKALIPYPDLEPLAHQRAALEKFIEQVDLNDEQDIPTDTYAVLPPSGGKTILGMFCIYACQQKTLVVVPTKEIEEAWLKDAKKMFGEKWVASDIGRIRGAHIDTTKPIVIGSIQTLMKLDPAIWASEFGMVIFDELHRLGAEVFANTVKRCRASIRLGLTATDFRRDGRFISVRWHLGDPFYRSEERTNSVPLIYHPVITNYGLMKEDEEFTFNDLLADLEQNSYRNNAIAWLTQHILSTYSGDILIVSPRTEHISLISSDLLAFGVKHAIITGTTPKRKELYNRILEGDYPVTIATSSIMTEGASNPRWHHVISTMPFSDPKNAIQLSGRCIRKAPDKKCGYFWDLIDANPMCRAMYKTRWKTLRKFLQSIQVFKIPSVPPYTLNPSR